MSVLQDQKSVIFLHSVIKLDQLLQHSKHNADILLTFRNYVNRLTTEKQTTKFSSANFQKM